MSYQNIIRHRSVWMGIAMIWIVAFHMPLQAPGELLQFIRKIGYGGVDLCLFASGVGCYYSLKKDPDPGRFMGRRLWRLGPVYLIFLLFWLPWQYSKGLATIPNMLGNLFGIQYLTDLGNGFNWYISAILVFYLLAPFFRSAIDGFALRGRVLLLAVLLAITIPFWMSGTYIILVTRIPVFYLGMLFAAGACEERKVRVREIIAGLVLMVLGLVVLEWGYRNIPNKMWAYGVYWYPFLLIAPVVCVLLSLAMGALERIPGGKTVIRALSKVGEYSFEIYLIHIPLVEIMNELIAAYGLQSRKALVTGAAVLVLAVCCVLLHHGARIITRWIKKIST